MELRFLEALEGNPGDLETFFTLLEECLKESPDAFIEYVDLLDDALMEGALHDKRWKLKRWVVDKAPPKEMDWDGLLRHMVDCYPGHPTLAFLATHVRKEYRKSPRKTLDLLETLIPFVPGTVVRFQKRPGKITEANERLGVFKVRLDDGETVSVPFKSAPRFLTRLSQGSPSGASRPDPASLRKMAHDDPQAFLAHLCENPYTPMTLGDVTLIVKDVLEEGEITSWWEKVTTTLPMVKLQKGTRISFRLVRDDAEVLDLFTSMDGRERLTFVSANARRFPHLKETFLPGITANYGSKDPELAFRTFKTIRKVYGEEAASWADLFARYSPAEIYLSAGGSRDRLGILMEMPADQDFLELLKGETDENCITELWKRIDREDLFDLVTSQPVTYPAAFIHALGRVGSDETITERASNHPLSILQSVLDAYTSKVFTNLRDALNGVWGQGKGANYLLKNHLQAEEARELLSYLEDIRTMNPSAFPHDALKNAIILVFPELAARQGTLWCTRPSLTLKEKELEHLVATEIPATRKAVSERLFSAAMD